MLKVSLTESTFNCHHWKRLVYETWANSIWKTVFWALILYIALGIMEHIQKKKKTSWPGISSAHVEQLKAAEAAHGGTRVWHHCKYLGDKRKDQLPQVEQSLNKLRKRVKRFQISHKEKKPFQPKAWKRQQEKERVGWIEKLTLTYIYTIMCKIGN